MSRFTIEAPVGDTYYPIRVVRSYGRQGDVVVEGDPLFDLTTANGRPLSVHASNSGRVVALFCEVGSVLTAPQALLELEPVSDGLEGQAISRPATTPHLPAWDDDVDDEVWEAKPPVSRKRNWRKLSAYLATGLAGLFVICVAGWLVLSYMPLASDSGDTDGYYGARTEMEPLGGRRGLFNSEEQQERFELWLDS